MVSAEVINEENLKISSNEILNGLRKGRGDWEKMVPEAVAKRILENKLMGCKN